MKEITRIPKEWMFTVSQRLEHDEEMDTESKAD